MYRTGTFSLSEVARDHPDAFVDGPFGSNLKAEEYVDRREVRLVQLQNIGIGQWLDKEANYISYAKARALSRHVAYPGDIAIAKMADPVARACLLPYINESYVVVADCVKLQVDLSRFEPRFIVRVLNSNSLRKSAEALSIGSTRLRINLSTLKRISIPAIGLSEQRQIADILDSCDTEIRNTDAALCKLRFLRTGIIRDALARLPDGRGTTVGALFHVKAGVTLGPDRTPGANASKYLRVANVQRGSIDLSDIAQLAATPSEKAELQLRVNDLLVVEGHASSDEIGRCALVGPDTAGLLYQNHLFRLRSSQVNPDFAEVWLNSDATRAYWRRMSATSSGLYTINSQMLRAMPFPTASAEAQQEITKAHSLITQKIGSTTAKLAKLRLVKQGLIEDLLTGRVRVPDV